METIGDCYVAGMFLLSWNLLFFQMLVLLSNSLTLRSPYPQNKVCGLPTPNPNHAVVMASFARRCLDRMLRVVSELEILLGPGTSELGEYARIVYNPCSS